MQPSKTSHLWACDTWLSLFLWLLLSVSPTLPSLSLPCHHSIKRAFLLLGNRCVNLCVCVCICVCVWPRDIFRTEQAELQCQSMIHSLLCYSPLSLFTRGKEKSLLPFCPLNTHNALCVHQIHQEKLSIHLLP